jgi:hypothetical protein
VPGKLSDSTFSRLLKKQNEKHARFHLTESSQWHIKLSVNQNKAFVMNFMKRSCLLTTAILGVGLTSHANLLVNGSFESGIFVPDSSDTMSLAVGATDMTGWTVQTGALAWIGPSNPFGLTASDGSYFLDLSGYHDNAPYAGVVQAQTISTTIGAQYRLSLDIGTSTPYNTAPVSVLVTAGSASTTFTSTPLNLNQWQTFTFDFIATSANTSISLDGQAGSDQKYIGLDNASVVLIPEPTTLTLLAGSGLLALAARRWLRKA